MSDILEKTAIACGGHDHRALQGRQFSRCQAASQAGRAGRRPLSGELRLQGPAQRRVRHVHAEDGGRPPGYRKHPLDGSDFDLSILADARPSPHREACLEFLRAIPHVNPPHGVGAPGWPARHFLR